MPITAGVVFVAAATGDQGGYLMGRCVGPGLFQRPHSRLFNPTNVTPAQVFFERRGPSAVVIVRFIPVVRAFTKIVAGIGNMRYRTFLAYNLFGAALYAVVVILVVSFAPIALEFVRHRRAVAPIVMSACVTNHFMT